MKSKIFYFTLQDEQTKEEKLDWFERTKFEKIPFEQITPDQKGNWINLTNNDFDRFLPLIDKEVKAGRSQRALFQLFSAGVKTQRDEWVYDLSKEALTERMKYFVDVYGDRLENGVRRELDIKWDRELDKYFERRVKKKFENENIVFSLYRYFTKMYFYFDRNFNKLDIFHYVYAILHHPAYRTKYELNLKREFPRVPFYDDFQQWATWGKRLMDLHINFEEADPYELDRIGAGLIDEAHVAMQTSLLGDGGQDAYSTKKAAPKCKLKADKIAGTIELDTVTTLKGIPAIAWEYKLGNRSALEWVLDQYKEKKPKDPTIAKLFNTYKFADYKERVIDLLQRVCNDQPNNL